MSRNRTPLALTVSTPTETPARFADASGLAAQVADLAAQVADLSAELKIAKAALVKVATARRDGLRESGEAAKTVRFEVPGAPDVQVQFGERYRTIPYVSNHAALVGVFGSDFDRHVEVVETVSLRKGATLTQLTAAAGEAWSRIAPLFETDARLAPRKGAPERIASMYQGGDTLGGDALQQLVDACSSPTVRTR